MVFFIGIPSLRPARFSLRSLTIEVGIVSRGDVSLTVLSQFYGSARRGRPDDRTPTALDAWQAYRFSRLFKICLMADRFGDKAAGQHKR
jgi:hypothetical protein